MNKKSSNEKLGIGASAVTRPGMEDCRGISPEKPLNTAPNADTTLAVGAVEALGNSAKPITVAFRASLVKPYHATLSFSDLSDEEYRVYEWSDGSAVRLDRPMKLNVSKSGGHRVYTADGISHYIPSGWNHLYWLVKENCPHFAF